MRASSGFAPRGGRRAALALALLVVAIALLVAFSSGCGDEGTTTTVAATLRSCGSPRG